MGSEMCIRDRAYTLCGALAGLAGLLWVGRYSIAFTELASGYELTVIEYRPTHSRPASPARAPHSVYAITSRRDTGMPAYSAADGLPPSA